MNEPAPAAVAPADELPAPLPPRLGERVASFFEVLLCSGYPTQTLILLVMIGAGRLELNLSDRSMSLSAVAILSLADTVLLIGLIVVFLGFRGPASPRLVFFGNRRWSRELVIGLYLVPLAFALVAAISLLVQHFAPWLHNVPENPLGQLVKSPRDLAVMAVVVVVAGGIREELQRAFILNRFEQHLGGRHVGLILFSLAFGLAHIQQGRDAALVVGLLGAIWGYVYLRRQSVVASMVCHSVFNLVMLSRFGSTT